MRPVVVVGLLLVTMVSLIPVAPRASMAQEATPAACPATTPEENAQLITDMYAAVAAGEDITTFLAAEHTTNLASGRVEISDVPAWAMEMQEDFGNLSIAVEHVMAQDDRVAAYVRFRGTHQDDDEVLGYPATGREAEWVVTDFFRVECGKIVELRPVADSLGRLRDLGVVTDEELRTAEGIATPAP